MKIKNEVSKITVALTCSLAARQWKLLSTGVATIAALALASTAQAQYTEIGIASQVNADLDTYTSPNNYPSGGTQLTVAGVPFALAEVNNTPNTFGIVQSPAANVISSGASGAYNFMFSVPSGTHAQALYCLMDSVWGTAGVTVGTVVVTGTLGETATLTITEGVNVRDCNNDGWVNTVSDPTVVSTYFSNGATTPSPNAQVRLDRQELILPSSFTGDTIESIDFEGTAQGFGYGDAFLAGMTVGPVPEPSTSALMAAGIAALVIFRVRRSMGSRAGSGAMAQRNARNG